MGSKIGPGKAFDRVCSVAFILAMAVALYLEQDNIPMMILFSALIVIAIHLVAALFRRVIVHYKRPLYEQVHEGYKLARNHGWQASLDGLPQDACPYPKDREELAGFEKRWMSGYQDARVHMRRSGGSVD